MTTPEVLLKSELANHNSGARKAVEIKFDAAKREFMMLVDGDRAIPQVMAGADGSIDVTRLFIGGYPQKYNGNHLL